MVAQIMSVKLYPLIWNSALYVSFEFECVGLSEVEKVMKNLASKNSPWHDGISARYLKKILAIITPPLTHIVNRSLYTGIIPDCLKIAKVIPLFKKGDQHVLDNYRPISPLTVISKVFEKIVYNQLFKYFTDNSFFFTPVSTVLKVYIPQNLRLKN